MIKRVVALALLSAPCLALSQQPTGPYVGAFGGSTDLSLDIDESSTYKTDLFTWGLVAGWQINPYFAVEAGYFKPNSINESIGADEFSGSFHAWSATALVTYPLSERWSVHARAGGLVATEKYSAFIDGVNYAYSDDTSEFTYGVGVGVIVEGAKIRLDYQRTEFNFGKASVLSIGVNWYLPIGN